MLSRNLTIVKYFFFSFFYALVMVQIPGDWFRDRENYLIYATIPMDIYDRYLSESYFMAFFNEPLFLFINKTLGSFINPSDIVISFVFFICFFISFSILSEVNGWRKKFLAILLILCIPGIYHLQNVVIRQGIATTILLLTAISTNNKKWWVTSSFIMSFVHSSFFIITVLIFVDSFLEKKNVSRNNRLLTTFIFSIVVSFSLLFLTSYFSLRQAESESLASVSQVSGMAFVLWFSVFVIVYIRGSSVDSITNFSLMGLVVYLSMYFISPVAGRIIFTFLPFIVISLLRRINIYEFVFLIVFICANIMIFPATISSNSLTFPVLDLF